MLTKPGNMVEAHQVQILTTHHKLIEINILVGGVVGTRGNHSRSNGHVSECDFLGFPVDRQRGSAKCIQIAPGQHDLTHKYWAKLVTYRHRRDNDARLYSRRQRELWW